jgi:exodeoxyribonuclease VII small subunit
VAKSVKSKASSEPSEVNFEQALQELEQIVHQLEDGQLPLDEALGHYEKGVHLLKKCYQLLEHAERRIELLRGVDAAGRAVTEPLDETATDVLEGPRQARPRSNFTPDVSGRAPDELDVDDPSRLF